MIEYTTILSRKIRDYLKPNAIRYINLGTEFISKAEQTKIQRNKHWNKIYFCFHGGSRNLNYSFSQEFIKYIMELKINKKYEQNNN